MLMAYGEIITDGLVAKWKSREHPHGDNMLVSNWAALEGKTLWCWLLPGESPLGVECKKASLILWRGGGERVASENACTGS